MLYDPHLMTLGMRAELKNFLSNGTTDWEGWIPADPSNVMHWFTLGIGRENEPWAHLFQVAVATRRAVAERSDKRQPFKGIVLDPFEKEKVEPLLREFVASITGGTWDEIVQRLRKTMTWEYE